MSSVLCYVNCELICTKLFEHQSQVTILRRSALSFSWQCFMWKTKFSFILSNITIIFPSYFNQERVSFIELNRFWQKFPVSVKLSRKLVCIHCRFPNNISLIRGLSVFFFVPNQLNISNKRFRDFPMGFNVRSIISHSMA